MGWVINWALDEPGLAVLGWNVLSLDLWVSAVSSDGLEIGMVTN